MSLSVYIEFNFKVSLRESTSLTLITITVTSYAFQLIFLPTVDDECASVDKITILYLDEGIEYS